MRDDQHEMKENFKSKFQQTFHFLVTLQVVKQFLSIIIIKKKKDKIIFKYYFFLFTFPKSLFNLNYSETCFICEICIKHLEILICLKRLFPFAGTNCQICSITVHDLSPPLCTGVACP